MKKIIALFLIFAFCTSCSTKFSLQKRKYGKGFYFSSAKSNKGNSVLKMEERKKVQMIVKEVTSASAEDNEPKAELSKKAEIDLAKSEDLISETSRINGDNLTKQNYETADLVPKVAMQQVMKINRHKMVRKVTFANFLTTVFALAILALGFFIMFAGIFAFIIIANISSSLIIIAAILGVVFIFSGIVVCFLAFKLLM